MQVSINAPSYRRPQGVLTLDYLPMTRIWVCETEEAAYRKANPKADIVAVPAGVQGNLCRIRNWILDEEAKRGMDAVCLIDDDMSHVSYWEACRRIKVERDRFMPFLEFYSDLAVQFGAKLWGINVNSDKQNYREYTPFSLVSYIGGPFSVHVGSDLRYDERLPLKEDYDLTLQHINTYRRVLRLNKFYYMVKQGGAARPPVRWAGARCIAIYRRSTGNSWRFKPSGGNRLFSGTIPSETISRQKRRQSMLTR